MVVLTVYNDMYALYFIVIGFATVSSNNLALLSGTLRTYQRAGCDDDFVILRCPPGTSISIQLAQYGTSTLTKDLCRPKSTQSSFSRNSTNTSCLWPNALQSKWEEVAQGTWGSTVVEVCQKKRQCKFKSSPKTFGGNPCPGVRKYVEVAYKCRPYEFRSKVACQNEGIQLTCNPNSRIAIYSASYGRTEYESIQCPQPQGVPEETCLVSYGTETVMKLCHGKRTCDVLADIKTFGSPCRPESRMYLKVIYTCVPRKVLKEQFEGQPEPDELNNEMENSDTDDDFENYDAGDEFIRESAASPSSPNIGGPTSGDNATRDSADNIRNPPLITQKEQDTENQERLYLYLILSVTAAVVLCLILLVGRLLVQRQHARREAKFHANAAADHSLPNCFTDDISEIDVDIDLPPTNPVPVPNVAVHTSTPMETVAEVVRYPHIYTHTLRRQPETDAPRSLSSTSNTQYYYE
ncbi:protein eva-1 isoform X3 [Photinus pyralis]|uniref:protein eva-1 isoform X3 n=1 Tax=Photinus pyralis TaxID=7054 RepID=UPI001266F058|nr:protein eva-1 isoform X3 [Photinus pyralis]